MNFIKEKYSENNIEIRTPGGKFKDERISKIVSCCESLGINTIEELFGRFKEEFPAYFEDWIKDRANYFYTWNITPLLDILLYIKQSN